MSAFFHPQTQMQKTQADVQKMIQDRLKKIEKLKHSVALNKVSILFFFFKQKKRLTTKHTTFPTNITLQEKVMIICNKC